MKLAQEFNFSLLHAIPLPLEYQIALFADFV